MRTRVGHCTAAQVLDQVLQFFAGERIVCLHGVTADGLGHGMFAEPREIHFTPCRLQLVHEVERETARIKGESPATGGERA